MTDPRADLERLPYESLYSVARDESAQHRMLAIRILVERGSPPALQPDIVDEARALKMREPTVVPSGVIDIFAGKPDINGQIAALRAEQITYRAAMEKGLDLLERSLWRKLIDWCKTLRIVRAGHGWLQRGP